MIYKNIYREGGFGLFQPIFVYTNELVNTLVDLSVLREKVFNSLSAELESYLRREVLLDNIYASTYLDGNSLSREDIRRLIDEGEFVARDEEEKEVLNYLYILENLDEYHRNGAVSRFDLLKLYSDLLGYKDWSVSYRDTELFIRDDYTGEILLVPPLSIRVHFLIDEFLEWLNFESNIFHPVIVAGVAHYEIMRIQPFNEENGKIARLLSMLILYTRGFDSKQVFSIDDYYAMDSRRYYGYLRYIDRESMEVTGLGDYAEGYLAYSSFTVDLSNILGDITDWLNYYLNGVLYSVVKTRDRIKSFSIREY